MKNTHPWSDMDPAIPHPARDAAVSNDMVLIWDDHQSRVPLIRRVVEDCNLRTQPLQDSAALQNDTYFKGCSVAVVGMGGRLSPTEAALEIIRTLKQKGLTVISHEEGVDSWPIGTRCRALLAGASWVLDSADVRFAGELGRLVAQTVRAGSDRQAAEGQIAEAMRRLGIVGKSDAMMSVFRQMFQVATLSDLPVLIAGETGTGKELVAHAIHQLDRKRRHGPFIALNCGAINTGLAESELFGHRRGAFTGAERDRRGLIRAAEGGVLFLDEVGELSLDLQVKLLRVLQERRVLGLGEDQEVAVSVRVIAATNRNLEELVRDGKFRADLFHRLGVLTISIPSLRERPADLEPLIAHMVKKHEALRQDGPVVVSPDFVEALRQVDLPGNVRQLENVVRQALVNKEIDAPLTLRDLPVDIWRRLERKERGHSASDGREPTLSSCVASSCLANLMFANDWNLAQALHHCEGVLLEAALRRKGGNQSQTARLLGLTPRSVYSKIRRHQLSR